MHDANQVKKKLNLCLDQLENNRHRYTLNPTKDFTRRRKISFRDIMEITLGFAGKSLASELMDYFDYDPQGATVSAFVQQRDKVLPDAFRDLFDSFNQQFAYDYTYHGYRLLAVDGTDLLIPTDPLDQETYNNAQHVRGFNTLHINALYDLLNRVYLDVEVQPLRKANERTALSEFIPRLVDKRRAIIIGDRGYGSYDLFARFLEHSVRFLIRVSDSYVKTSFLSGISLPGKTFDIDFDRILTRSQTKMVKENPDIYKLLPSNTTFEWITKESPEYHLKLRFVQIQLDDGSIQCFATNCSREEFPPEKIQEIYFLRWGIETSFRTLKHIVGLTHLHSKKVNGMLQEIVAAMTMYNVTSIITSQVILKQPTGKHTYQINFSKAVSICRKFLRHPIRQVEALIAKHILPVRSGKMNPRKVRFRQFVSFNYRIA